MIVSEQARFAFIHIQKTGGSSIKQLLRERVPDARGMLGTHDPAQRGLDHYGERWGDYFRFAFVRNPWDRLVSWYVMLTRWNPERTRRNRKNGFWVFMHREAGSFENFLVHCTQVFDDHDGRKSIAFDQLDYLVDESGAPIVDFVGRFEQLEHDVQVVLTRIGISGTPLGHVLKSPRGHYSEYYTPALRDLVGERHRRDIEAFGYAFETSSSSSAPSAKPVADSAGA